MTTYILKHLLPLTQDHHLMKQPQRNFSLQLLRIPQQPPKNVQMCLMVLAPPLQRRQVVEIRQPERLLGATLHRLSVQHVHEAAAVAADIAAVVAQEIHPFNQHGVHGFEVEFPLVGAGVRPVLA